MWLACSCTLRHSPCTSLSRLCSLTKFDLLLPYLKKLLTSIFCNTKSRFPGCLPGSGATPESLAVSAVCFCFSSVYSNAHSSPFLCHSLLTAYCFFFFNLLCFTCRPLLFHAFRDGERNSIPTLGVDCESKPVSSWYSLCFCFFCFVVKEVLETWEFIFGLCLWGREVQDRAFISCEGLMLDCYWRDGITGLVCVKKRSKRQRSPPTL